MKSIYVRVVIVFLAFLLSLVLHLLVYSYAGAQTPLPTDTPVPTPVYDCPDPGVITDTSLLDPEWAVLCAHCFTTPTPTSIFQINQTPIAQTTGIATYAIGTPQVTGTPGCVFRDGEWICPTNTPTITPTIAVTPTPTPQANHFYDDPTGVSFSLSSSGAWTVRYGAVPMLQNGDQLRAVIFTVYKVGSQLARFGDGVPTPRYWNNTSDDLQTGTYCMDTWSGSGGCQAMGYNAWSSGGWSNYANDHPVKNFGVVLTGQGSATISNITNVYYGNHEPVQATPTPTITPTPTVIPIDCSEPVYRDSDPAVEVDGVEYLGTTCPIEIPEFSIDVPEFLGVGGVTFGIPSVTVCVDWYSFPSMTIFNIVFSGVAAFLPLVIFAIIFIMRI